MKSEKKRSGPCQGRTGRRGRHEVRKSREAKTKTKTRKGSKGSNKCDVDFKSTAALI